MGGEQPLDRQLRPALDGDAITSYEGQEYGNSWKNWDPGSPYGYHLTGKGTTLLKVGTGLMYDRLWENPITPTYYNNKYVGQQISATWNFGQAGAPVFPNTIAGDVLPASAPVGVRNVYIVPDPLRMPETLRLIRHTGSRLHRQLLDHSVQRGRNAIV